MPVKSSRVDVDLFSQTLAEVITRNKYGGFNIIQVAMNVDANTDTEYISLTGTGYIYSSAFQTYGTDIQHDDYVYIVVDGVRSNAPSYKQMLDWGLFQIVTGIPFLCCYDEINYLYTGSWQAGITFEESVVKGYHESHGRTPYVIETLLYAVI